MGMAIFARVRKELPQDPERWKAGLEAALTVSEIAASSSALPDAVQRMVTAAIELLSAEQGSIMLLEDDGLTLVLAASFGLPSEVPVGHSIKVGESVAGRVLATGRPLLLGDVDSDSFINFVPKHRPLSSSIVVPLRVQGRSIGVLSLAMSKGSPDFTEEDLRLAQMFADQAAGLIYRTRLHEQAEHRSSDLMALVESSRGLVGTLDLDALLQHALDGASRLAGSSDGFACLFDPESGGISRGVFRGVDKKGIKQALEITEIKDVVENGDIAFLDWDKNSYVAVGLRTSRGTAGVLVARADLEVAGDRKHLMRAFGQQCNTALGAAELHSEVQKKESELSAIIHGVPNPIVLIDARDRVIAINAAAEHLFGISATFATGNPIQGALGHEQIESLLANGGALQSEVDAGAPPRTYKARVSSVHLPGVPMGRILVLDDVTSEREMAQKQRDFVAMIGHELRTPLTIIKGFARTFLRKGAAASTEDVQEALRTIDARAGLLERLIEDLLYVSQIETREASLRVEQVDIPELVQDVTEDLISLQLEREAILEIPRPLAWPCDETKLALVLRHLIENALKFSEGPEPVIVRATDDGEELRIDVIDKG
ncbi:MAG: hypothetical protein QOK47_39, partial [Actinomycetota bacterium]|nr:hypothetical protein [Actinomycetota bacterium]